MSYTRSKTVLLPWSFIGTRDDNDTSKRSSGLQSSVEETTGTRVPKFRSLIQSGSDATSAYVRTGMLKVEELEPFDWVVITGDPSKPHLLLTETVQGTWFPSLPAVGSQDVSDASTIALTRLYSRLSGAQTSFHGQQFLGELRQTISMLRHPYQGIRRLVDNFTLSAQRAGRRYQPRLSIPGRRRFESAIASSWLETSFGLMPLISDVREASKAAYALATGDNRKRDRIVGSAQTFVSGVSGDTITGVSGLVYARLQARHRGRIEHRVRYVAFLDWERTAAVGSLGRLMEETGFRPDLFIPTLYELIPWSWLVDYVSNLGTVIETGCQSQSAVKFCVRSASVINTFDTEVAALGSQNDPWSNAQGITGRFKIVRSSFVRSAATAQIPNVPFQLSLPGRPTQYANVLAVWRSRVRNI